MRCFHRTLRSSIAEFYSRNLANEAIKGMNEKVKKGGSVSRATLTIVFPGRAEAFAALTAIDEDLSEIKEVRDAMINADERLEAEWIRREALGEIHDGLAMRAVGSLPAREDALINWNPSTRELSGRKAHARDNSRELEYHAVNIVDLRDQLCNIEFGVSRLSSYVETMTAAAPGPPPLPWRATKTVSTDPR